MFIEKHIWGGVNRFGITVERHYHDFSDTQVRDMLQDVIDHNNLNTTPAGYGLWLLELLVYSAATASQGVGARPTLRSWIVPASDSAGAAEHRQRAARARHQPRREQ